MSANPAPPRRPDDRADLHIHTVHSDGTYTPAEVIDLARRSGLAAVAITDHDTIAGLAPARQAAGGAIEVVNGIELTAEYHGRGFHLLGYFFRPDDSALSACLELLRQRRQERFWQMVERFQAAGVSFSEGDLPAPERAGTLGRRYLAALLVKAGKASTLREAFQRYFGRGGAVKVPRVGLPLRELIAVVRGAGGVAAWAHPAYDWTREQMIELRQWGVQAVETEYPSGRHLARRLRTMATQLGLAVSGGSDCHGPDPTCQRALGACTVTLRELENLRQLAAH